MQSGPPKKRTQTGVKEQSKISKFLNKDQQTGKKWHSSRTIEQQHADSDIDHETINEACYSDYNSESEWESDVNLDMKTLLLEIRKEVKNKNRKFHRLEKNVEELKRDNRKLKEENNVRSNTIDEMSRTIDKLEELAYEKEKKNEHLEAQSRRENLKFFNVSETRQNESWEETVNKIRQYLTEELEMDPNNTGIEWAHRLPSKTSPRPIIVKFSFYKTKETVLRKYREKAKEDKLNQAGPPSTHVRVSEDFVKRVLEVRRKLLPFMRERIANGQRAYLKYDKLIIDGIPHTYNYETKDLVAL